MGDILLVSDIFPPQIGGPATFINELAETLSAKNLSVTVLCNSNDRPLDDRHRPFRILRFKSHRSLIKYHLPLMGTLAREVSNHRHVFSNGLEYQTAIVCSLLRRKYVVKVVGDLAWEHSRVAGQTQLGIDDYQLADPVDKLGKKWRKRQRFFLKNANKVIAPSEYVRGLVVGWGIPADKVTSIANGVHSAKFSDFNPTKRSSRTLNVVFIGRLTNWKGVDTLLQAMKGMDDLRVSIVGDGPEMESLRAMAANLGVAHFVSFLGRMSPEDTLEALRRADALVLMSGYEGLSHTLLEAAAAGVPAIASDCGGNPETLRQGDTGLLLPYGDHEGLASALRRFRDDEDSRFAMACAAKKHSLNFDFKTTVQRTTDMILQS